MASCDLNPSFFASRASAFTACEMTLLFWNSLVFKNSRDWVISPVLPKLGCAYRSPRDCGLVNADFDSEVLSWDSRICICHPCSDSSDAACSETTLCSVRAQTVGDGHSPQQALTLSGCATCFLFCKKKRGS